MRIMDLGRIETDFNALIQTVAELMDRVYKLEIKTANLYEQGKDGLVQGTAFNLDLSNLDTKKEHALRLQLRDTKEQFKQLEEAHRKLKRDHDYLLVKHSRIAEENKMLWEENRKLKGGSMLSRIVCDIATIIEHSDADSFTESIAKNLLNYINGGGR